MYCCGELSLHYERLDAMEVCSLQDLGVLDAIFPGNAGDA